MTSARHVPPRWVRWTLGVLIALVVCAVFGVTSASAELSLGPNEARYDVTTDGEVVVDLGPLGTLQIDSPLPANLGVQVTVQEIPADLTAFTSAQTMDALSQDLQSYLQFFSGPQVTIEHVARALITNAVYRTVVSFTFVALAVWVLRALLGQVRRRELSALILPRFWPLSTGVVLVTLMATMLTAADPLTMEEKEQPSSPLFAGTALEGARITGRLAGVIDTYGAQLVGLYEQNNEFYENARVNVARAWDARIAIDNFLTGEQGSAKAGSSTPPASATTAPGATAQSPTPQGALSASATADATNEGVAHSGDAGSESPSGSPVPRDGSGVLLPTPRAEDIVTMVLMSDLHCNTGMTPVIRTVVQRSGATVILNAGDSTMNGTAVESFCVNSFASVVPKNGDLVISDGNHDSATTSVQERAAGAHVLDGTVLNIQGIRILGDRDAMETRVGQGTRAVRTETPAEQAERTTTTACDTSDGIDLLLIHTPAAGTQALKSGCVPVQISGHTHVRSGPVQVDDGIRYVSASTAGAASGQPTVGPLHGTAEMTVLRFDKEARRFIDWQLVEVNPAGKATVSSRMPFPVAVPAASDANDDEGADGAGTGGASNGTEDNGDEGNTGEDGPGGESASPSDSASPGGTGLPEATASPAPALP